MVLSNSPRQLTVLRLEARKSVAISVEIIRNTTEEDGPVDLTDSVLTLVVAEPEHKGGAVLLTRVATELDLLKGLVRLDVQADEVDLAADEYPFAMTLTSPENFSSLLVKGVIDLQANVDLAEVDHELVAPPLGLTVELLEANRIVVKVDHHPDALLNALYQAAADAAAAAELSAEAAASSAAAVETLVAELPNTYVASDDIRDIVVLSQAAYDAIPVPVATTMYVIV